MDREWLDILVCPVCKGTLVADESRLICRNCEKAYPVRDGIPVMLVEEAESIKEGAS
ncbi:MAG: Trm112 family protein [bacterium]